jgi:hypothetical protein
MAAAAAPGRRRRPPGPLLNGWWWLAPFPALLRRTQPSSRVARLAAGARYCVMQRQRNFHPAADDKSFSNTAAAAAATAQQRLFQISAHVGAQHREAPRQLIRKLEQSSDGTLTAAALRQLRKQEAELVASRKYREAAMVADMLGALGPRQQPPILADCTHSEVPDQIEFFLENGFCVIEGVLEGESLERAQAAWLRAEEPERRRWDAARAENLRLRGHVARPADADSPIAHYKGYEGSGRLLANGTAPYDNGVSYPQSTFDLPKLCASDPEAFLGVLDSPKLLPLLSEVCLDHYRGPAGSDECMSTQVCGAGGFLSAEETSADSPYHGRQVVSSLNRSILTEIYPCHACSYRN